VLRAKSQGQSNKVTTRNDERLTHNGREGKRDEGPDPGRGEKAEMMTPRRGVEEREKEDRVVVVDDKLTGSSFSCENKRRFQHVSAQLIFSPQHYMPRVLRASSAGGKAQDYFPCFLIVVSTLIRGTADGHSTR
jgi:hypothetical protein